jgi:hypothetical protein
LFEIRQCQDRFGAIFFFFQGFDMSDGLLGRRPFYGAVKA